MVLTWFGGGGWSLAPREAARLPGCRGVGCALGGRRSDLRCARDLRGATTGSLPGRQWEREGGNGAARREVRG